MTQASAQLPEAAPPPARRFSWREFWRARGRDALTLGGFFGAVFQREVRAQGRRASTYVFRCLYALLIGSALAIMFSVQYAMLQSGQSPAEHFQSLQQIAPILTLVIGWIAFVGIPLMGVIFAAPSVSEERRRGSLAEMLTTPLTAREIILGKVGAVFVQLGVFALVPVPVLLASRVFGGVDLRVLLAAGMVVTGMSIMAVTLTVLASVLSKRGAASISLGLVFTGMGALGFALVYGLICASLSINPNPAVIASICPPIVMAFLTAELAGGGGIPVDPVAAAGATLGYSLIVSAVAVLLATVLLRRLMLLVGGAGAPVKAERKRRSKASPAPAEVSPASALPPAPTDASPRRKDIPRQDREAREVGDNPVLWRETRQTLFVRRWHAWLAGGAIAALLLWVYWQAGLLSEVVQFPVAIIGTLIVLLTAATTTGGTISSEREGKTWPALVTTPLSPSQILTGKFWGAVRKQWPMPAIISLHLLLTFIAGAIALGMDVEWFGGRLGIIGPADTSIPKLALLLPLILATLAGPILFLTATGTLFSLIARKSAVATTCNLLVGLGVWVLVPVLAAVLQDSPLGGRWISTPMANALGDVSLAINPVFMTGAVIDACVQDGGFDIGRTSVSTVEFVAAVAVVFLAYVGAAWTALRIASVQFNRFSGRSS